MLLQDFVVLHFMDIDQTPSRKWAGASSCYLKTEYADDSVLDTVVVGFCNSLFAFILNRSKCFCIIALRISSSNSSSTNCVMVAGICNTSMLHRLLSRFVMLIAL